MQPLRKDRLCRSKFCAELNSVTLSTVVCDGLNVVPMILDVARKRGHSVDQMQLSHCTDGEHALDIIISLSTLSGAQALIARLRTICAVNGQANNITIETQFEEEIECKR